MIANVTLKINHPISTTVPCVGVEPPQITVAAVNSGTTTTTEVNVCEEKQGGQIKVGASTTDSYPIYGKHDH